MRHHNLTCLCPCPQDKYILGCMLLQCCTAGWHAAVSAVHAHYGAAAAHDADHIALSVLAAAAALFHVIYVGLVSGFVSAASGSNFLFRTSGFSLCQTFHCAKSL